MPIAFSDGIANFYSVNNGAEQGNFPVDVFKHKGKLRYAQLKVGITRFYAAMQNNVKVATVIRCPLQRSVSTQDIVITSDGEQYRVIQAQYPDDIKPPVMDLTLERVTAKYEINGFKRCLANSNS